MSVYRFSNIVTTHFLGWWASDILVDIKEPQIKRVWEPKKKKKK
jgi:hypothetical protein